MKFLKSNILSIVTMSLLFTVVMLGDAAAAESVFGTAISKMANLFTNAKLIIFMIGGFGLVALAFQAIFGKVKWAWFAALAFGLAVVAAAGAIVNYAANTNQAVGKQFADTLGNNDGI
ncbi:MAG: hypothetical protein MSB80_03515 [Alphaproteobacteria bacterium]|nr:hypothetical protein [Alphaproteobacteria bacterium]